MANHHNWSPTTRDYIIYSFSRVYKVFFHFSITIKSYAHAQYKLTDCNWFVCKYLWLLLICLQMSPIATDKFENDLFANVSDWNWFDCKCLWLKRICLQMSLIATDLFANVSDWNWFDCKCLWLQLICLQISPIATDLFANVSDWNWFVCKCLRLQLICLQVCFIYNWKRAIIHRR